MNLTGTILVTGGTGSFGKTIVRRLLNEPIDRIRVLSRDEAKQDAMREEFASDRLEFITGDVRDPQTVENAMRGARMVFHAAALKQVPNCEKFPMEAIRTNVLGSENVRQAALRTSPETVVAISTDKACEPINAMGLTKALMERLLLCETDTPTRFVCVRYGNVIGSRGSVIPLYAERIRRGLPLPVTDFSMTRFLLHLGEAVETAITAAIEGRHGQVWVRKMPAATIRDLVTAMAPTPDYPVDRIGIRPGEKLHEVLVNENEMRRATDHDTHFVLDGEAQTGEKSTRTEYTSFNTDRLDVDGIRRMLAQ